MQLENSLLWEPLLTDAIDHHPLKTSPEVRLIDAITQMNHILGSSCLIKNQDDTSSNIPKIPRFQSSCILIVVEEKLLGIITERDIVKLTAQGIDFNNTTVGEVMTHPVISLSQTAFKDIFAPLFLFRRYQIRHLPIVDEQERLIGVISPERIRKVLQPIHLLKLRRVEEIMTSNVIQAPLTATLENIAQLMSGFRVSCIVITEPETDDRYLPVGIITERDILQYKLLNISFYQTIVQDVMSQPLILLSPEDSLWKAHQEMKKHHIRRLVVSWNWGRGLGLITQTNILKIFDPIEMNSILLNIQQTLTNIENKSLNTNLQDHLELSLLNSPEQASQSQSNETLNSFQKRQAMHQGLTNILFKIQTEIEDIIAEPNLSSEIQQSSLETLLIHVKQANFLIKNDRNCSGSQK
ncbi:CBS domain-containing protein [Lyngbya sp. PCC 8106]|uniref:CBS domain-containing protein n=1 Tax=Lyngbya sp. (strain PCC 8106) TaxID=313612 RepID=UPI0000EAA8E5|nr:CBS domain-containing protein [Lyngbya sp. PCC 8106]EAW34350.1 Multi-sensor Hybrid Histidine Kinase [Lyngbya sp. PCC 8106]